MSVLSRYISVRFSIYCAAFLVGMTALSLTFELLEEADQVLGSTGDDHAALIRYSLLRLPDIISKLLPFAALIAAILTLALMHRHSEVIAIWSSGISWAGICRTLFLPTLLLVVIQFLLNDWAVPRTLRELQDWGVGSYHGAAFIDQDSDTVWLRSGHDIVRIPASSARAGDVSSLQVFRRNGDGLLIEQLDAANAVRMADGSGWNLLDVVRRPVDPPTIIREPEVRWDGRIDIEHLSLIAASLSELSIQQIVRLITNEGYGQRPTELYQTWFQFRLASALSPMMMVLLVVALAQRFSRTGIFARLLMSSVALGFGFFVFDGTSLALGEAGLLPPWMAGWSANLILLCIIGFLIVREEG